MEIGTIKAYGEELRLILERYRNGRSAIRMESGIGEPYGVLTVNIPEAVLATEEILVKTWAENEPFRAPALASGLFKDTGRRIRIEFVDAEVWKFVTH